MSFKSVLLAALAAVSVGSPLAIRAQTAGESSPAAATAPETGESGTSTPGMPAVTEPGPQSESGMLGGDKPFTLMVDPDVGELNYIFGETKELESIQAKRGVVFSSEDMTLNSDEFEYQTLNSQLVATGKRVVVRLGDIIVTCQLFKYNPDTQEGEFTGGPVVYSRDAQGKTRVTAGGKISIHNVNGKTQMKVEGRGTTPYIRSNAPEAPVPTENNRVAPGGTAAKMSLDNNAPRTGSNASPLATPAVSGAPVRTGNMLGLPTTGGAEESAAPTRVRGNRIDPNNPDDVRSIQKKPQ